MAKTRKLLKVKPGHKRASVKEKVKKASRSKAATKRVSKKKRPVVTMTAPMEQVQALTAFLRTTREKQIVHLKKQCDQIEPKLNKLLAQENKAREKLSAFEQKVGDAPKNKDKQQLKRLANDAGKAAKEANVLQNERATLQKVLESIHEEMKYLTALEDNLKRFWEEWQRNREVEAETTNTKSKNTTDEKPQEPQLEMDEVQSIEEHPTVITY
jgi:poly-D-alanine transfer protein DltD